MLYGTVYFIPPPLMIDFIAYFYSHDPIGARCYFTQEFRSLTNKTMFEDTQEEAPQVDETPAEGETVAAE